MSVDIKSLIMKKNESKIKGSHLILKDVNRSLIVSLLAIPIYGKDVRDDEILSIIINAGTMNSQTTMDKIREDFNRMVKEKKVKKGKDGVIRDTNGYIVLKPKGT